MSECSADFELLQAFARAGDQRAFATVARRHLNLVFAMALRKVSDAGAAEEIAQNVFATLARKAWRFAPDDSLPAWLHRATLLESKSWLRGELRRRRREETAAEQGTTMKTPDEQPALRALVPLLDEALLALREQDRVALLLRFYEGRSLREVGASLGAGEDAARKRVAGAVEKLADFFQRRGFKTATVAAIAAALQQTATTVPAATATLVVNAALQSAPSALAGLGLVFARLASMSRVQTAAVCVALAAVPVGLQLNERHTADEEVARMQSQLLAAQNEGATLQSELERLRVVTGQLEQSLAQANEAAARAAASAQAFAAWKQNIRRPLLAADYRWLDESPFVRIPKSALPELSERSNADPFSPPGVVASYARELMGMTPSERQSVEATLQRHFAGLAELERASEVAIYETNKPLSGPMVAAKEFVVPGLPEGDVKQRGDQVLAELRGTLGEERWPLVLARLEPNRGGGDLVFFPYSLRNILMPGAGAQKLEVQVSTDDKGAFNWLYVGSAGYYKSGTLTMFLPEGDPNRTKGAEDFGPRLLSEALRRRAVAWLEEQAIARLGKKEKP